MRACAFLLQLSLEGWELGTPRWLLGLLARPASGATGPGLNSQSCPMSMPTGRQTRPANLLSAVGRAKVCRCARKYASGRPAPHARQRPSPRARRRPAHGKRENICQDSSPCHIGSTDVS